MSDTAGIELAYFVPEAKYALDGRLTVAEEVLDVESFAFWELIADAAKAGGIPAPTPEMYATQLKMYIDNDPEEEVRANLLRASAAWCKAESMCEAHDFWEDKSVDRKALIEKANTNFDAGLATALNWAEELGADAAMRKKEGDDGDDRVSVPAAEVCAVRIWNTTFDAEDLPRRRAEEEAAELAAQPGCVWLEKHKSPLRFSIPSLFQQYIDRSADPADNEDNFDFGDFMDSAAIVQWMSPLGVKALDDGYVDAPFKLELSAELSSISSAFDDLDKYDLQTIASGALLKVMSERLWQGNDAWAEEDEEPSPEKFDAAYKAVLKAIPSLTENVEPALKQPWDEDVQETPFLDAIWNEFADRLIYYYRRKCSEYEGGSFKISIPAIVPTTHSKKKRGALSAPISSNDQEKITENFLWLEDQKDNLGLQAALVYTRLLLQELGEHNWATWSQGRESAEKRYALLQQAYEEVQKDLKVIAQEANSQVAEDPSKIDGYTEICTREPKSKDDLATELWNRLVRHLLGDD